MTEVQSRRTRRGKSFGTDALKIEEKVEECRIYGSSSTSSFDRFCPDLSVDGSVAGSPIELMQRSSTTSEDITSAESSPLGWPLGKREKQGSESVDDYFTSSVESSPFGWPLGIKEKCPFGKVQTFQEAIHGRDDTDWRERKSTEEGPELPEIELMQDRFAKLLLGEDMSGKGGVCTALAISNAITNLAACVFGGLWKLEPLDQIRKIRWQREIKWLLAVCDHIVEFVPSCQTLPDGNITEVMITKPRSDLQIDLPALRRLDIMLIESLDIFKNSEFWYTDRAIAMAENDGSLSNKEKWWLPVPHIPSGGLSPKGRKQLQGQRDSIQQVLKAVLAINRQALLEMEVPSAYWEALPKTGRSSLGEALYHKITSDKFSPETFVSSVASSKEHSVQELMNRVEAAMHIWRRKIKMKQTHMLKKADKSSKKASSAQKTSADLERREILVDKAETICLLLRQKFPGLPQSMLDVNKIQYNKDVGKSILESYSRVLESLASNIISRIDDVLFIDSLTHDQSSSDPSRHPSSRIKVFAEHMGWPLRTSAIQVQQSINRPNNSIGQHRSLS